MTAQVRAIGDPTYRRLAAAVLIAHQRTGAGGGCLCGAVGLGESWAEHVATVLDAAGALRHPGQH